MAMAWAGALSRHYGSGEAEAQRLRAGVEAWRRDLLAAVAEKVRAAIDWDEGSAATLQVDLGAAGWSGLRLFAFYAEQTHLEMPDTVPALLELDPAWRAAADGKFANSRYGHLLACRVWLPGDVPVTLRAPMPDGSSAEIGSLAVLQDQLRFLNARTLQADAATVATWEQEPAPAGGDLLGAAQRGLAGMLLAAAFATGHRVPLLVVEP